MTFTDKASGKDGKRPQLEAMQSFVSEGDTVFCHSMDRLARNLDDLRRIVLGLTKRGVHIVFVKENLTFTGEDSPMSNLLLSVMGAFAQFERVSRGTQFPEYVMEGRFAALKSWISSSGVYSNLGPELMRGKRIVSSLYLYPGQTSAGTQSGFLGATVRDLSAA